MKERAIGIKENEIKGTRQKERGRKHDGEWQKNTKPRTYANT